MIQTRVHLKLDQSESTQGILKIETTIWQPQIKKHKLTNFCIDFHPIIGNDTFKLTFYIV